MMFPLESNFATDGAPYKRPWLQFTPDGTMICSYCVDAKFFFLTGNQIDGFGCPAFEIGTTWIFF